MRRIPLVFIGLVLLLGAGACRGTEGDPDPTVGLEVRIISQVIGAEASSELEVRWFPTTCESFDRYDLTESDSEVEVTVHVLVDAGQCEAPEGESSIIVDLAAPLGSRAVVDGNLGSTVALNADPQPPE